MNPFKYFILANRSGFTDFYSISTDAADHDGFDCITEKKGSSLISARESFCVKADFEETDGVCMRNDTIQNTSEKTVTLGAYASRFTLYGSDYEVYTQQSTWENESNGAWHKLVSKVCAEAKGVRTTDGSSPMLALWSNQTQRGVVFHLLPEYAWSISATVVRGGGRQTFTVVDIAINDANLSIDIAPGEKFSASPIIFYEFRDKLSLDCHKLHAFLNAKFPHRRMPVIYNTWFAFFDKITLDAVHTQIKEAAAIGCDYFTLDAGWFGDGLRWEDSVGHWVENKTGAYMGKMNEISDAVHESGMKFGLWLEPERALKDVPMVKEHPEYYFKNENSYFLDFANPHALKYITDLTIDLIEKYNIDFFKFDFNDNITVDRTHKAFYEYHKGSKRYVQTIRQQYPDIYIECCSSGGLRMELSNLRYYDGFWFSDDQSPYTGRTILKNTILRFPPNALERWTALVSCPGFTTYGTYDKIERTIACDNATWDLVAGVNPDYIKGFFTGGSPGITCDITRLSPTLKDNLRAFIASYKSESDFWNNAVCRILCDTEDFLVLQYETSEMIKVVVYSNLVKQSMFTFYPVINACDDKTFSVTFNEKTSQRSACDLRENGISFYPSEKNSYTFTIK